MFLFSLFHIEPFEDICYIDVPIIIHMNMFCKELICGIHTEEEWFLSHEDNPFELIMDNSWTSIIAIK